MKFKRNLMAISIAACAMTLTACEGYKSGDNDSHETNPIETSPIESGITSNQTNLSAGNEQCFQGGVEINTDGESSFVCSPTELNTDQNFTRIASFPVCSQLDSLCNTDTETAAEIVAANNDGTVLVYTDSPMESAGFINLADPKNPVALGTLALAGEPTSVAVKDNYALIGVNTSEDFINVSGQLDVIDIDTQALVASLNLGGQPDSVAISPTGNYAAVVLENERDEDLGDGEPPQLPAGSLIIVDTSDVDPANWSTSTVNLTGIASAFPSDPEPEFVDINSDDIAVVTMQENNHIVLVDLSNGNIVNHFSAGAVDLTQVDLTEGKPLQIDQSESQANVVREPDGVSWINNDYFATADEGDLNGGSRGFTIFSTSGEVIWSSGNSLDHMTASIGHYPDKRSGNKGNEPENVELGIYGDDRYLFVNSERSSLVFVYDVADPKKPLLKQILPAAAGPEGALAIPGRDLLVVASEEDNRGDKLRSVVNIYQYGSNESAYPTVQSANRDNGTPIPWAAMSGLSSDPVSENTLYAVEDSFYQSNRIFTIDVSQTPALLSGETTIKDSNDIFANFPVVTLADTAVANDDASRIDVFDETDLSLMINTDKSINIDPEGVSRSADGGFWVASEGNGTVGDSSRPVNSLNLLFKTDGAGVIEKVISLPKTVNDIQLRFGFEGVTEFGDNVYVAFQRAWGGEANPRIGIFNTVDDSWTFVYYPLDSVESSNGGWVGLSDLTSLGNGEFLVLERDNQGGPDAAIKRLYKIDLNGAAPDSTVSKTLVRDLMSDLKRTGGLPHEKVEGSAVMANGDVYIINDNDGVDDNSGETQLINLGKILN